MEEGTLVSAVSRTLPVGGDSRVEIDTSAPFESVKEAVNRFGGSAVWKSQLKQLFAPEIHHCREEVEVMKVEAQAAQLQKDLIVKERETLEVLKELEMTKKIVDGLKLKMQKEALEVTKAEISSDSMKVHPVPDCEESFPRNLEEQVDLIGSNARAKQSAGLILMELKQAKVNLSRTTSDLAGIRAAIELLNGNIEKEKILLEKTREKLNSNNAKVSCLEEDLNQTALKLQLIKGAEGKVSEAPLDISKKIRELSSESEQFKKMAEVARSEASKLIAEIEQTKASIATAEIRCLAAKKMEEAAKAAEAVALAEIKALTSSNNPNVEPQCFSAVTLTIDEYALLTRKAQEADEVSRKKVEAAMLEVDEANKSNQELVAKVEEATVELKTSRNALEEALKRVESANRGKLAVEDALRRWRSEHGQKKRFFHNSTKFKNSYASHLRRDSKMLDVNGQSMVSDCTRAATGAVVPTLSIGQILSRKLLGPEDYDTGESVKNNRPKVSLGQMLSKRHGAVSPQRTEDESGRKQFSAKRKKFGFVGFSLTLAKQNKKNKKKRPMTYTC